MSLTDPATILFLVGVSLAAAAFAVAIGSYSLRRARGPSHVLLRGFDIPRSYVFRDGYLVSDHDERDAFLTDPSDRIAAWGELKESLTALHPEVATRMEALRQSGAAFVVIGRIGSDELSISGRIAGGRCYLTLATLDAGKDRRAIDAAGLDALESELDLLRHAMNAGDTVFWVEDETGAITWANQAYFSLLSKLEQEAEAMVWPIHRIFEPGADAPTEEGRTRRMSLTLPGSDTELWFELACSDYRQGRLCAATPADRLVAAETSLRDFVQTLTRTFAHLPIGLAIFDKTRRLVLFNPALVSLSTLSSGWLSSRPDLFAFLDQLREKQRMPEPKNYQAWRAGLAELEKAAQDGTYQEMWTLPNGQTFRVIGRPHADGAVAFLFEDISQEVTLTRQFRGDLDLYQSVIDADAAALAVFSRSGKLMLSNAAYKAFWPERQGGIAEASASWQKACDPTPIWGDIRDFVSGYADRVAWSETVLRRDGRGLKAEIAPLKGGATLVRFTIETAPLPVACQGESPEVEAAG